MELPAISTACNRVQRQFNRRLEREWRNGAYYVLFAVVVVAVLFAGAVSLLEGRR